MNRHVRSGDSGEGDRSQGRHWACPFYVSNPIRHAACMAYKLARVPDVRQHIERKHADEAGEKGIENMKRKKKEDNKRMTNEYRWYALWTLFFPGQVWPPTPYYTGNEFADLSVAFVSRFMEEWEKGAVPGDVKTALAGYVAFVKTTSLEMKSGRISIQPVAGINERRPQDTGIHNRNTQGSNTYQGLPLSPSPPATMIMGPPHQPDPRSFFSGYYDAETPNVPTQAQAPSMPVANGQYLPRFANPTAYSAASAHQLPPLSSLYPAAANGLVDYVIDLSDLSGAMDWTSGDFDRSGYDD